MSKINPAVSINLDKERKLLFVLNAMVFFEEATGKSLFDNKISEGFGKSMTAKDLRALLWACLVHEDETLTLKQVGSWINRTNMTEIAQHIGEAFSNAMPDGEKETSPLAQNAPTG
jgi:hypothetical protein